MEEGEAGEVGGRRMRIGLLINWMRSGMIDSLIDRGVGIAGESEGGVEDWGVEFVVLVEFWFLFISVEWVIRSSVEREGHIDKLSNHKCLQRTTSL